MGDVSLFLIYFYFSVILELYFKTQVESFCVLVKTTQYKNKKCASMNAPTMLLNPIMNFSLTKNIYFPIFL